jgi:predicted transcriptional regulator
MPAAARRAVRTPLARALSEADKSNRWLARALGIHDSEVSRWCHAKRIDTLSLERMREIAKLLKGAGVKWASVRSLWPEDEAS